MVRDGILGLFIAFILFTSISIGLSLESVVDAELLIDFSIVASGAFAATAFLFKRKVALTCAFLSIVLIGVAWGGHAATRESLGNIRAVIGSTPALIQFRVALISRFQQPEAPNDDLLDRFQNAVKPPRFRARAQIIHVTSMGVVTPISGMVTLFIDGNGAEFEIGDVVHGKTSLAQYTILTVADTDTRASNANTQDNEDLDLEANRDNIFDFTERDPFSEGLYGDPT